MIMPQKVSLHNRGNRQLPNRLIFTNISYCICEFNYICWEPESNEIPMAWKWEIKNLWKNDCSDSMHRNDQDSECVFFCATEYKIARKKKCAHFHFDVFYHTAPCYDLDAVYAMLNTVIVFLKIRAKCNIRKNNEPARNLFTLHRTWYEFNNATVYFVVVFSTSLAVLLSVRMNFTAIV